MTILNHKMFYYCFYMYKIPSMYRCYLTIMCVNMLCTYTFYTLFLYLLTKSFIYPGPQARNTRTRITLG